jgi:hypothetical protein
VASHLDADVLADFREGLLSRRRSARISTHLTRCARCSSLDAGLAEVTALLASAPAPTMPTHLVARLENALAAEVAARAATADGEIAGTGSGTANGATGTANGAAPGLAGEQDQRGRLGPIWRRPDHPARRPQRRTGLLGATAVIAAILVVGVYGLVKLTAHGNSASSASSGAAGPAQLSPAYGSRGLPTVAGGSADLAPLPTAKLHLTASGTDYQPGKLASQVTSVLSRQFLGQDAGTSGTKQTTPSSASSGTEDQLRACVTQITGGTPPRLVDQARYQGRPATIIVQAAASGQPQQVWVVGPACSAGHPDLIAHTELTGQG